MATCIWLEQGADLHMAQLMPLPLTQVKSFNRHVLFIVPNFGEI